MEVKILIGKRGGAVGRQCAIGFYEAIHRRELAEDRWEE